MKTLKNKLSKLNKLDAILWGQMIATVIFGTPKTELLFWGLFNLIMSPFAIHLIFNAVKF